MRTTPQRSWSTTLIAGWGAMDFNGHLANTAYLNLAADARLGFFAAHGFPPREFHRLGIGPVIRKDELEYFREIHLHEPVEITCALSGMSSDGSRFVVINEFSTSAGRLAARVQSTGSWLSLAARHLVAPPAELLDVLLRVPRTYDFAELGHVYGSRPSEPWPHPGPFGI